MSKCTKCGKEYFGYHFAHGECQSCYRYYRDGGKDNPLPPKGVIEKDDRGYVICHMCGRGYKRLGSHAKESHMLTIEKYKEMFGLCVNAKTTEDSYSEKMNKYAIKNNMPERLMKTGYATRIKKGDKLRYGIKARLQECIMKRN